MLANARLWLVVAWVYCPLSSLCLLAFGETETAVSNRPNIILIVTDDQGYAPVSGLGHPWIKTPAMDRLLQQSTRISTFLVSPTCSPTRSVMTGRHPMRNGITHTIVERERMTLDAVTLPQVLKDVGYQTAMVGKWHLGDEDLYQPNQRGFDYTFIHGAGGIGQAYDCSCADAPGNRYFDPVVRENGTFVKTKGFCTDIFFEGAIRWLDSTSTKRDPFFLYIATNAPHAPFHAPDSFKKRFVDVGFADGAAGFFGMIENIDWNLNRLLNYLDESQLSDNTIVIFMSDNGMSGTGTQVGESFATGFENWNSGMRGLKGSVDEGGVRVPFFVRWPNVFPQNTERDCVAAHVDILPTLAELAGAELPTDQCEGISLVETLKNGKDVDDRLLITHVGRWPIGADPDDYQWCRFAIRSRQFRLVSRDNNPAVRNNANLELFDMVSDPGQTQNIIDLHPEMVTKMTNYYEEWWTKTRQMLVNETAPQSGSRSYWDAFEKQNWK
ncbi:MAG: arylsulfatase [Pirellulaceae bacterium]